MPPAPNADYQSGMDDGSIRSGKREHNARDTRWERLAVGMTAEGVLPRVGLDLFQGEAGSLCQPGAGAWAPFLARRCEHRFCRP